jgi:hypothetical protein
MARGPRYNKVSRWLWSRAELLAMGPPPISPQLLWVYLLTCERPTCVAGLLRAGPGTIADETGWPSDKVRKALDLLHEQGHIVRSLRPPMIWIEAAIECDRPEGPKQLAGWEDALRSLPACEATDAAKLCLDIAADTVSDRVSDRVSPTPSIAGTGTGTGAGSGTGAGLEATPLGLDAEQAQRPAPEHPLSVYVLDVWSDRKLGKLDTLDAWASRQQDACPGLDLVAEAKRAAAWEDSNPGKRKRDIRRFLGSWFGRQQDRGPGKAGGNRPPWERTLEDVKAEVEANLRAKGIDPDALAY